jgi:hypothetical protein
VGKSLRPASYSGRYLSLDAECFESDAFRDLTPKARCLLFEFIYIWRPDRNGKLVISTRNAAKLIGVNPDTIGNAYHELVEHGFLVLSEHENWRESRAREFELTVKDVGQSKAKNLWKQWQPGKPVNRLPKKIKSRA